MGICYESRSAWVGSILSPWRAGPSVASNVDRDYPVWDTDGRWIPGDVPHGLERRASIPDESRILK